MRVEAKISEQLRIATRTTRIQSDAKNLLFDCILNKLVCCYARSLQARCQLLSRCVIDICIIRVISTLSAHPFRKSHWFPREPYAGKTALTYELITLATVSYLGSLVLNIVLLWHSRRFLQKNLQKLMNFCK